MSVEKEQLRKDISTNKTDITVSITKGVIGAVPVVGPLIAEVIGNLIPNQRIDRIISFVKVLETKIQDLGVEQVKAKFANPGFVDLLEDGFFQVARALTKERIEYIASVIKNSLSEEEIEYVEAKKLLWLLGELNDIEIIILRSYLLHPMEDQEFWEKHKSILDAPRAYMGAPKQDIDKSVIHKSYKEHLLRLGLTKSRFKRARRGELPEFDEKTGMMKCTGYEVTYLGRLLLQYIDLAKTPWEADTED